MADTRFMCSVCGTVFSDHRASVSVVDPEEDQMQDQIGCPSCGSAQLEPYEFDPDGPVENPLEGPGEAEHAS